MFEVNHSLHNFPSKCVSWFKQNTDREGYLLSHLADFETVDHKMAKLRQHFTTAGFCFIDCVGVFCISAGITGSVISSTVLKPPEVNDFNETVERKCGAKDCPWYNISQVEARPSDNTVC